MTARRFELPPLAAATLIGIVAFLFRGALFDGRVFYGRDIGVMWVAQAEAFVRSSVAGSWPVWDPHLSFGRPLLANANNQVLYPLTWLNPLFQPWHYYKVFVVAHFLLAGAGTYLLARRLSLSRVGACVAAAAWIASGPFVSLVTLWNHLAGAAWISWAMLGAEATLQQGGLRWPLLWGGALAAQILAGSPDMCVLTGLGTVAYAVAACAGLGRTTRVEWRRALGGLALAGASALALSAAQWLPMAELAMHSVRWTGSASSSHMWDITAGLLAEVVLRVHWFELPLRPELFARLVEVDPYLSSLFLGIPGAGLFAAALATSRPARLLGAFALLAVVLALGSHAPLHAAWALPPLRWLRYPAKALVPGAFAWAIAVGIGADAWRVCVIPRPRWLLLVTTPLLALSAVSLTATLLASWGADTIGPWLLWHPEGALPDATVLAPTARALAIGTALGILAAGLAWVRSRAASSATVSWVGTTAALTCVMDLLLAQDGITRLGPERIFTQRPEVRTALGEDPRVYVEDYSVHVPSRRDQGTRAFAYTLARVPVGWTSMEGTVLGLQIYLNPPTAGRWRCYGSFDADLLNLYPAYLRQLVDGFRDAEDADDRLRLLRLGSVSHVLSLGAEPWERNLVPLTTAQGVFQRPIQVYRVPDPLPRTYVVAGARIADGAAALAILLRPDFAPSQEVVLPRGTPQAPGSAGSSSLVEMKPDRVRIAAELTEPGYVVLVDAFDPGWQASLDGRPAEVLRANLAFRAVAAPAGHHVLELRYRPASVTLGGAVSAAGLLACLALLCRRGSAAAGPVAPPHGWNSSPSRIGSRAP